MTVTQFVMYPLLTAMLYYLGARAMITQWLWSRYPPWLDHFMMCSACSGVWYGGAVAAIHGYGMNGWSPTIGGLIAIALASGVWTPFMVLAHNKALEALGTHWSAGTTATAPEPEPEAHPQRILDGHGNYWDRCAQEWKPLPK